MKLLYRFLMLVFAGMLITSVQAQINVFHVDQGAPTDRTGVFYALPRTVVKVEVKIDRIDNYKGPYSEYALRFLGLKNVVQANSVEYQIEDVTITTVPEPDPDQYYFVEMGEKLSKGENAGLFALDQAGLILGTIPEKFDTVKRIEIIRPEEAAGPSEKDLFPEVFKYYADMSVMERVDTIIRKINIDTMTLERQYLKRSIVEKSPEQKAKEAADYITKIKDNRFNLISGYQEVNYNKETLEYMDTQLKIMEKEYMKLFTGISIHKPLTFSITFVPSSNQLNSEIPLFKFTRTKGILDLDEPGGKIVTIKVQKVGNTNAAGTYAKSATKPLKQAGFYYRIPEKARIIVKLDDNSTEETQCLVNQLGIVTCLPATKWRVQFYKETGGVKGVTMD